MALWILQTNEQAFLDDCRDFRVYGVRSPSYKSLQKLQEGDAILLRLRLRNSKPEFCYLGPYVATSQLGGWVPHSEKRQGVWHKIVKNGYDGPRWLSQFPWCVFLLPAEEFINELR